MNTQDWRERKYREVYEESLRGLMRRLADDPRFSRSDAEGTLRHLYVQEGNDQGGRGGVADVHLSALIAAHEHFIRETWPGVS